MSCLVILVGVSLWHGLQVLIPSDKHPYKDYVFMGVVMASYVIYNIYFWLRIYFGVCISWKHKCNSLVL